MGINWVGKDELFSVAYRKIELVDVILDIGCGIMPQRIITPQVHICCEPFGEYMEVLQRKILHERDRSYIVLSADWQKIVQTFPEKSVDSVFLIDVIEHLTKEEAINLLIQTEKIVRNQVVVFTPLGFMPQNHPDGKDAWGLTGGHMQEHKSGWQPEDFGKDWEIIATKEFHEYDNLGKKFDTPYGALWAIKTYVNEDAKKPDSRMHRVEKLIGLLRSNTQLGFIEYTIRLFLKIDRLFRKHK